MRFKSFKAKTKLLLGFVETLFLLKKVLVSDTLLSTLGCFISIVVDAFFLADPSNQVRNKISSQFKFTFESQF
jgi:hypothetical protein